MKNLLISILLLLFVGASFSSCKLLKKDCDCPPTPAKIPLKLLK